MDISYYRTRVKVLGIDPGIAITGFACIHDSAGSLEVVSYGCIRTSQTLSESQRLCEIHENLSEIVRKFQPDCAGVEKLFVQNNIRTVMSVSQARGVVLQCLEQLGVSLFEYTPLQVKQAITGYGRAEKCQVQKQVTSILGLSSVPKPDDVADALAIACCHAQSALFLRACSP